MKFRKKVRMFNTWITYNALETPVRNMETGEDMLLLANKTGQLFVINLKNEGDKFEYVEIPEYRKPEN